MKRSKYRNVLVKTAEGTFRSKAEYARWCDLKMLRDAGEIFHLQREVRIPLHCINHELYAERVVGYYTADAVYSMDRQWPIEIAGDDCRFGTMAVVEDTKGGKQRTALFRWKAKHFEFEYGFAITVVEK